MKFTVRSIILISFLLVTISCAAYNIYEIQAIPSNEFPPSQKMKIGVLEFLAPTPGDGTYSTIGKGSINTPENAGQAVADAVASELLNIPNVAIIERSQLNLILKEHEISITGVINNPDFKLLGEILPVNALVLGTVTTYCQWHEALNWGATVSFNSRIVDVRSGQVLAVIGGSASQHNGMVDPMAQSIAKDSIKKLLREHGKR